MTALAAIAACASISVSADAAEGQNKGRAKPQDNDMKSDTVTVPIELMERLDERLLYSQELFDLLDIDSELQRRIEPAYVKAERLARRKQIAHLQTEGGKVPIKVDQTITIPALDAAAVDECVALFAKDLPKSISRDSRKVLQVWARQKLEKDFSSAFSLTLRKQRPKPNPDGSAGMPAFSSLTEARHNPRQLWGYSFRIDRLENGRPQPGTESAAAYFLREGNPFELFFVDDPENPAAKSVEAPPQTGAENK